MEKLNFEWHDSRNGGEYRAEVSGFVIRAVRDDSPESPWDAWDGQPPLIVYYDRSLDEKGDVPNPLADMSDSFIARNWRALCKIFYQSPDAAKERKSDYEYERIADAKRELLDEWLDEIKPSRYSGHAGDYMTALGELCELRGWPSLSTSSHGYCQRDYAELLLIFSPAYAKEIGAKWPRTKAAKAEARERLKSDAKLWGAWAWGDVYGFVIESLDSDGDPDGDCLDSCFGFYGDNFAESGLAEAAAESLSYIRQERRERRLAKLKELIRARVPLAARAAILEGFPL